MRAWVFAAALVAAYVDESEALEDELDAGLYYEVRPRKRKQKNTKNKKRGLGPSEVEPEHAHGAPEGTLSFTRVFAVCGYLFGRELLESSGGARESEARTQIYCEGHWEGSKSQCQGKWLPCPADGACSFKNFTKDVTPKRTVRGELRVLKKTSLFSFFLS